MSEGWLVGLSSQSTDGTRYTAWTREIEAYRMVVQDGHIYFYDTFGDAVAAFGPGGWNSCYRLNPDIKT